MPRRRKRPLLLSIDLRADGQRCMMLLTAAHHDDFGSCYEAMTELTRDEIAAALATMTGLCLNAMGCAAELAGDTVEAVLQRLGTQVAELP